MNRRFYFIQLAPGPLKRAHINTVTDWAVPAAAGNAHRSEARILLVNWNWWSRYFAYSFSLANWH